MSKEFDDLRRRVYGSANPTEEQVQAVRKRAQAPVRKPTGRNPEIKKDALVNAITSSMKKNTAQAEDSLPGRALSMRNQLKQEAQRGVDEILSSRTGAVIRGAAKSTASGFANTAGTALDALRQADINASQENQRARQELENARRYREMVSAGRFADGRTMEDGDRERLLRLAELAEQRAGVYTESAAAQHEPLSQAVQRIQGGADRLSASSQEDIATAKEGLGRAGQFAVDVGVAGTQLLGDILAGSVTGGGALLPMAVRSFGSSAQTARQSGADLGQQLLYGTGSAALSVATEKISNVAAPFKAAFGAGVLDDALSRLPAKLSQSAAGRTVLSAIGEGGEEVVEDLVQPLLQRITYDSGALSQYQNPEFLSDTLYDGLIGAALGGVGGAADVAVNRIGPTAAQEGAGAAAGQKMGTNAAQVWGGSEGVQDAWRDTIVNEVRRNSGIGENESPASTSDGTSALSGDLETVVDAEDMAAIPGTVGTVTDGRASQVAPISTVQETGINVNHQEGQNRIRNTGETVRVVETLRDHIPKLSEAEPVSEVSSNSIPFVSGKTMAEKAKTLFEAIKGIVSRPGFGDIEINTRSVKDDLHHGIGTAKAAVIPAIPDIIRTGTQIDFQENWKGRPYDGYIFAAPVTMDGKTVYVAAVVKRTSKNRFYLHEVVDSDGNIIKIDAGDSANQTSLATNGSAGTQSQASVEGTRPLNPDSIIAPGAENVNPPDGLGAADAGTLGDFTTMQNESDVFHPKQSGETYDNLGSAREGFTTPGMEGKEQTSRLAESMPYNQYQEAATGLSRDDYAKLFRYMSQTEGQSIARAEELVYFIRDGHRTFLRDIDEAAFHELVQSLDDATAWNAPQMDAARMIQQELQGKSANMEIPAEEYTNFLQIMREHETSTGQGVQANAKWSRRNNQNGQTSELEAWENLQNSNLSDEGRQRLFQRIVQWDTQIEQAQTPQQLKDIILEVSRQRGVLNNSLTNRESRILTAAAGSSLDALSFDQLKQFAYAATSALSTDSTPVNWGQRIKTIQVLNMLSSPVTPARNLVGNTSFYGIDALAMRGASILDMALSHVTGTRSVASGGTSLNAAVQAMRMAIAEITMDVDMSGTESRYGTSSNRTFRAGGRLPERVLSMLERNQAYLLNATDEFYKGLASGTARRTQALVDSGKIRTDNPGYAQEQAQNLARYRTFQDNSALSIAIQDIHDVLNMIAGVGDSGRSVRGKTVHSFGLGDIVAPFTRVAGNLASRGLEYSPVNAVRGTVEIARNVAQAVQKKTVDPAAQARAVSDTARGLTGTAIAYGFMLLARAGLLRQADDENDPDVAALNSSEGITGTQLNLSAAERWIHDGSPVWQDGDTLIDLSSVQPLNLLMNLGTEMAKDYQNPIVTAFNATSEAFMDSSAELPVMQFLGNAATDIIRYGEDPREVLLQEGANTVASSVIPNILRTTARGLDDRPRNTYTGDTLLENVRDTVQNSIPVLREELPGSVNPMGDEKTYQIENDTARLLNTLLNPIGVNTYTQSAVSREMETLRGRTGDTSFYLSKSAPSKVSYTDSNGKQHSKSLTYEERQDYLRERGAVALTTFSSMMGSRAYRGASDEEKATLLNLCGDYASQRAKKAILGDDSVPAWVGHAENAQRELGVSPAEYLALYRQYGSEIMSGKAYEKTIQAVQAGLTVGQYASMKAGLDSDGNNSVSQTEAQAYLDRQDFTREQKADLWTIINKSWKRNPYT